MVEIGTLVRLVDFTKFAEDDDAMDPVTKDYVDVRIESAEERADRIIAEIKADSARADERLKAFRAEAQVIVRAQELRHREADRRMDQSDKTVAGLKRTIIATGIAVVLGVSAANAALFQATYSAFVFGRYFGTLDARLAQVEARQAAEARTGEH